MAHEGTWIGLYSDGSDLEGIVLYTRGGVRDGLGVVMGTKSSLLHPEISGVRVNK